MRRKSLITAVGPCSPRLSRPASPRSRLHVVACAGLVSLWALSATPVSASDTLELIPDLHILPFLIAGFLVLVFPLNQLIFKPIFRALDERTARIQGARDRSTQLQRSADDVLDRYETAIREARAESEVARQQQLAVAREEQAHLTTQARGEAEGELDRARTELSRAIEDARSSLRAGAEELAKTAAEQVLGRALS